MSAHWQTLTHGTEGFELAYTVVLIGMLAALYRGRASAIKYLLAVLLALPMTLVAAIAVALTSSLPRAAGIASESGLQLAFGAAVLGLMGYAAGWVLLSYRVARGPQHRRGAVVSAGQAVPAAFDMRRVMRRAPDTVTIAGVSIPLEDETKHFKFIGTTGTGKSTAIEEILSAALARGDRAIVADPDGGYLRRFYDPARGDVILNPWHSDARKWDLFGEMSHDYDIEHLARSLIPDSGGPDRIWCEYARTFLSEVMRQAIKADIRDDGELVRIVTRATVKELKQMLEATPAGPFLADGNEKMFGSLRSVASSAIRVLQYTVVQKAAPLSVRGWVRAGDATSRGGRGGVLFLPYKAGEIAALRSVVSAWMRLGVFEAMDRDEVDQRMWFVVDELDALGEIDGLKDALARLRKFGGRCILGFQSIAQVSGTYGRGSAETIVENCGNTLILRCSASEHGGTSEFASKLIGQREVVHTVHGLARKPGEWVAARTRGELLRTEAAVMASEIERLPDLTGFLKLASIPDWQEVRLTPTPRAEGIRTHRPSAETSPATPPGVPGARNG
ncbi:MAG: type IV secretion system DNA-binding domain-containing protein [Steroidobacteraceae bacterium]